MYIDGKLYDYVFYQIRCFGYQTSPKVITFVTNKEHKIVWENRLRQWEMQHIMWMQRNLSKTYLYVLSSYFTHSTSDLWKKTILLQIKSLINRQLILSWTLLNS